MTSFKDPLFKEAGRGHEETWFYSGDMNLEHGGLFYTVDDLVEAIEVFSDPATDNADYDDEAWYIRGDTGIHLDEEQLESALETSGYERVDGGIRDGTGEVHEDLWARRLVIESFHAHAGVEAGQVERITRSEFREQGFESLADYVKSLSQWFRSMPVEGGPEGFDNGPSVGAPKP